MDQDQSKNRKSKEQERLEEADNAGLFADSDSASASDGRTVQDNTADRTSNATSDDRQEASDAEARRDFAQSHDYKGEAQNVNDDAGRPLNEGEVDQARNKANEGLRQRGEG